MSELLDIFHPSYVLRNVLYGGMITGFVLPFVGVLMYARRMVFLGVTLPQVSAMGIAAAAFWHYSFHETLSPHSDFLMAFMGSTIVTIISLLGLSTLERRGKGLVEGRIGVLYVFAGALTVLLLASDRIPEVGVIQLLRGQIIAISDRDMWWLVLLYGMTLVAMWVFRKELLLVAVDRDMAVSLGKRIWIWDLVLYGIVGITISLGVLMVGPLLVFAFLLLPPMIALRLAGRFSSVPLLAGAVGACIALVGFVTSVLLDWPAGATNTLVSCVLLGLVMVGQWVFHGWKA